MDHKRVTQGARSRRRAATRKFTLNEIDTTAQRMRELYMHRYDDLPAPIRQVLSECPFDVHIGLRNRHWNVEAVVKRISAIRTTDDAIKFNSEFAARKFMRS